MEEVSMQSLTQRHPYDNYSISSIVQVIHAGPFQDLPVSQENALYHDIHR